MAQSDEIYVKLETNLYQKHTTQNKGKKRSEEQKQNSLKDYQTEADCAVLTLCAHQCNLRKYSINWHLFKDTPVYTA